MTQFLLAYIGGDVPEMSAEEGKAHFQEYQQWLADLGDHCVSAMNPLKSSKLINADRSSESGGCTGLTGFTILQADSMEEATVLLADCPFLDIGGRIELSEIIPMG
ncbi:MAG: hypothetical protein P8I38_06415 [Arenicella sp.]|jgi:hypothetical protein|nr:hypothetical protein [bacterium]MDG1905240.1 hypothetical protein [Arenicella sp.]HAU69130.1 hypothetical protein [Gammaproteobacteria bacterium]